MKKSCITSGPVFLNVFCDEAICGKICLMKEIMGGKSFNAREIT